MRSCAFYLFIFQHRIDYIAVAINRRLQLVVDNDGLLPRMGLQHAALEAPEASEK